MSRPGAVPADVPFALVEGGSHGLVVTAVNGAAIRTGIRPGLALADARAMLPALISRPSEPARDRTRLLRLAAWLGRYGPSRNADPPAPEESRDPRLASHSLWIDITGVAHLFGGEVRLLDDLARRLAAFRVTARAGVADTPGAAQALARFATSARTPGAIAEPGNGAVRLAPLPVEALRLAPDAALLLRRLGLKTIGDLYGLPRAALAHRFRAAGRSVARARQRNEEIARAVLLRLDQALGVTAEPRAPLATPPAALARLAFEPPLVATAGLEHALACLTQDLCAQLAAMGHGARRLVLTLYRTDGSLGEARAGTSQPSRDSAHLGRLLGGKLAAFDAGFGIDLAVLSAAETAPLALNQMTAAASDHASAHDLAQLIDRLANRLGPDRVLRLAPVASRIPEQAQVAVPMLAAVRPEAPAAPPPPARMPPRPAILLERPEPVTVVAEVPDGAPARLVWRRHPRRIVRAEGPERIAGAWWQTLRANTPDGAITRPSASRDYYHLEDDGGRGYWVFREGLYPDPGEAGEQDGQTDTGRIAPRWFLHGVFT